MRTNKRADERVAQYLRPDHWLFQTTVHRQNHRAAFPTSRITVAGFTTIWIVGEAVVFGTTPVAISSLDEPLAGAFSGDLVASAIVHGAECVTSGWRRIHQVVTTMFEVIHVKTITTIYTLNGFNLTRIRPSESPLKLRRDGFKSQ